MKIACICRQSQSIPSIEALSAALVLGTFEHDVQVIVLPAAHALLYHSDSRLVGMLQSLDLYDIPKAWLAYQTLDKDVEVSSLIPNNLAGCIIPMPLAQLNLTQFDHILSM